MRTRDVLKEVKKIRKREMLKLLKEKQGSSKLNGYPGVKNEDRTDDFGRFWVGDPIFELIKEGYSIELELTSPNSCFPGVYVLQGANV